MFSVIREKISGIATFFQEVYDPNYTMLFQAVYNEDWEKIKRLNLIKNPYFNKYAHYHDNRLILEATKAEEFELVRELLELENVKTTLSAEQKEDIISHL